MERLVPALTAVDFRSGAGIPPTAPGAGRVAVAGGRSSHTQQLLKTGPAQRQREKLPWFSPGSGGRTWVAVPLLALLLVPDRATREGHRM